ncbi:MAG TPA: c-type cytochrome [Gemmatimonadales bacterium]|jgi:mono/diheme cytochrome c family protein
MRKCVVTSVSCIALLLSVACEKAGTSRASSDSTSTPPAGAPETTVAAAPETTKTIAGTATAPDTTQAEAPLRDAYHPAPLDTVDEKTYQGWKYYNLNCARCHGEDVLGTSIAPHLILSLKPDGSIPNEAVFLQTVCGGRPDKGMPAWCTLGMSTAQIDTIYSYVKARSDAKMHPGRPARRGG